MDGQLATDSQGSESYDDSSRPRPEHEVVQTLNVAVERTFEICETAAVTATTN